MAKKTNGKLKEYFLLAFLVVSVFLVGMQWADGIFGKPESNTPAFVRPTAAYMDIDEDSYENWNQIDEPTATLEPTLSIGNSTLLP